MVRSRCVRLAGWTFVALVAGAPPARGQDPPPTVLVPGEIRENIPAAGKVLQVQGNEFVDFRSWAAVSFERADALSQNIKLEAKHPITAFPVYGTAIARGMLFLDFCIPSSDAATGCGTESATPEAVTTTITFGYGYAGHLSALGLTSEATFSVTASILDRAEQRYIHIHELKHLSVKATNLSVKDLPVQIPGIENPTLTRPVTFTLILKRGRIYRYQLAAATTSTKGVAQPLVGAGIHAWSDFAGPIPGLFAPVDGFVQLRNLTIHVSPSITSLQDVVNSLEERIAALAEQLGQIREEHQVDVTALREELAELRLATIGPGPVACNSLPPGQNWLCVSGGWVPPDHPSAGGGPGLPAPPVPPPSAPTACLGAAPATGWVCVNGGWVPPDHPLARGGS